MPRLEVNGTPMSKPLEDFLRSGLDVEFGNVHHLVSSSTVLGYLHKSEARLKHYKGNRVSEVQTAGKFIDRPLNNGAWISNFKSAYYNGHVCNSAINSFHSY